MFIVVDKIADTIEWPVVVEVPVDGGKTKKWEFTGVFNRLSDDEKAELDRAADDEIEATEEGASSSAKPDWTNRYITKTMKVLVGWRDLVDQNKNPLPFNRDSFRAALRSPNGGPFMIGINRAIAEIGAGSKAKNS